ncbi:hypothetical protein PC9H_007919 [Pleurotus ostreatus]|uniref:Uncharacterized protein n=1 Tax=Pleurotus ostreatus TaxID=5322 RepID=A0A8H7DT74_PLEOS|nr:uncharacterized protein PC9H_007919 [Pleurotus ostreatus]KAF7428690.1 hypothetical protein PC9H_007919 [Pleurotus ostreatus]
MAVVINNMMFTFMKLKLRTYFTKKAKPVPSEGDSVSNIASTSTGISRQPRSFSHVQGWKQVFSETQVVPNCSCVFCMTMRAHDAHDTHEVPTSPSDGSPRPQSHSCTPSVPPMASVYDVLYPSRRAPLEPRGDIPTSTTAATHAGTRPRKVPAGGERCEPRPTRARVDGYFTGTIDSLDTPPPYSKSDPIRRIGSAPYYTS